MRSLLIALLLIPSLAWANAGKRTSIEADLVGEPLGVVDVAIVREELAIDLRPVANGGQVLVDVTYQLDNRGDTKQLALIFASGASRLFRFEVTLDGVPVPFEVNRSATVPEPWQAPMTTPGPGGGTIGFDVDRRAGTASFDLAVAPGAHRLAIRYRAAASQHHSDEPMVMHQFAYVLAPARAWTSFGQLAVTVHVPPGWGSEITPALDREGDTLRKTFTGVPADAVAITVHAPAGYHTLLRILGLLGFGLALLGGGFALWRVTLARARRRADGFQLGGDTAVSFALAVVWAVAITVAGWFAIFGAELAIPEDQLARQGYGPGLSMIGVVLLALVAILVGTLLGRHAARRGIEAATRIAV